MTIRFPLPLLLALALAIAGCNASGLGSDNGGSPADAVAAAPSDLAMAPRGPDLAGLQTIELSIGPIPLAPGQETTVCTVVKLPTQVPIDVVQIDSRLAPGSHHLVFYKSALTQEQPTPTKCAPLDIGFGQAMPKNIPLYIAETEDGNSLPLPAGAAYHIDAGQMVKLEAHYLNASPNAIVGKGTVVLTVAPAGTKYQPADIMFCGSVTELYLKGVPPGMSALTPGFYRPPDGVKVFGLTAHQHQRGTLMTISKSTGQQDEGTKLLDGAPWDNEPFQRYDDAHLLTFGPNEGLRWQCFYNNPDNKTVKFGESAESNEMCFLWAYYYPSVGHFISTECMR